MLANLFGNGAGILAQVFGNVFKGKVVIQRLFDE
jgi:hypothetical protein